MTTSSDRSPLSALRDLSAPAFKVWTAIQLLGGGICSISRLEDMTGLARSTVRLSLSECMESGYLSREGHCPKCGAVRADKACASCGCASPSDYVYAVVGVAEVAPDRPRVADRRRVSSNSLEYAFIKPMPYDGTTSAEKRQDSPKVPQSHRYADNRQNLARRTIENRDSKDSVLRTPGGDHQRTLWMNETRDYARHSAKVLGDANSLGFHIRTWATARKGRCVDDLFRILGQCEDQQRRTGRGQGAAFVVMVRQLFESRGLVEPRKASAAEVADVRASLAGAPFMQ